MNFLMNLFWTNFFHEFIQVNFFKEYFWQSFWRIVFDKVLGRFCLTDFFDKFLAIASISIGIPTMLFNLVSFRILIW